MTSLELAKYYAGLLIRQYLEKPNAYAQVTQTVLPVIMDQLPIQVQNAFTIGTAVGAQLDIIGKYVGVSRMGYSTTGVPITLDDADFTKLLKLAIVTNNSGSSLGEIQSRLSSYFGNLISCSDSTNMGLNYTVLNTFGSSDLLQMIVTSGLLPRPMGVQVSVTIITPGSGFFFGFRTYDAPAVSQSPFNSYPFYNSTTSPWLSYSDVP